MTNFAIFFDRDRGQKEPELQQYIQNVGLSSAPQLYLFLSGLGLSTSLRIREIQNAGQLIIATDDAMQNAFPYFQITRSKDKPYFLVQAGDTPRFLSLETIIVPLSWLQKAMDLPKIRQKVQEGFQNKPAIQKELPRLAPALYQTESIRHALLLYISICVEPLLKDQVLFCAADFRRAAQNLLTFQSKDFLTYCRARHLRDSDFLKHLSRICGKEIWSYMRQLRSEERKLLSKDTVASVEEALRQNQRAPLFALCHARVPDDSNEIQRYIQRIWTQWKEKQLKEESSLWIK